MHWLLFVALGFLLLAAPARADFPIQPPGSPAATVCVCAEARANHGWCAACDRGYVAGVAVASRSLYEMLDPHGHDVDVARTPCALCRAAWETEGFCERDGIGFAGGRAYVSRLAYLLARGEAIDSAGVRQESARLRTALLYLDRCELCAVAAFVDGRCPRCKTHYKDGRPVTAAPAAAVPAASGSR